MSRTEYYEEALASMSYPQQKYRMVNTGAAPMPNYGKVGAMDIFGGAMLGLKTVMEVRNAERLGQAQLEMSERLAQRQAITAAAIENKKAALDANKAKFYPIYIAGGLAALGIIALTAKQLL